MTSIDVPIYNDSASVIGSIKIFAPYEQDDAIVRISHSDAEKYSEEEIQIYEATRYEYEINPSSFRVELNTGIGALRQSSNPSRKNCGILDLKAYVGRLGIKFFGDGDQLVGHSAVEVRSRKISYRDDLRTMIEDITEHAVELAFELRAPTTLKALPDPTHDSQIAYQQFAFLKGLLDKKSFKDALQLVLNRPHERVNSHLVQKDIRKGFRPSGKNLSQVARGVNRFPVPERHPLAARANSLPFTLSVGSSSPARDVVENRFVRFVLEQFSLFLAGLLDGITKLNRREHSRLLADCNSLIDFLANTLNHKTLQGISGLQRIPISSPVLQQKSGYREVLQAWLKFDLAAKLFWVGGAETYELGKRDVAKLYEYWAFFKLFDIFSRRFPQSPGTLSVLFEKTTDMLGLKLRAGKNLTFYGQASLGGVQVNARFDYNRTFRRHYSIARAGSWTEQMRPDYTVSLWPNDCTEDEAEASGKISHIHFDAKYRVETIQEMFGEDDDSTSIDSNEEFAGVEETRHKRDDLLKMHAYRDAIRRSYGAYILYPGSTGKAWTEFHEILPGVGAFVLKPGSSDDALSKFFDDVISHIASSSTRADVALYTADKYDGVKSQVSS